MANPHPLPPPSEPQFENEEAALIERIRRGEKELFHQLVRPYERGLYLATYAILRNPADAEEAVQECLLKAFAHLDQLRANEKFKAWLLLIAMNEARMRRRKNHQHLFEPLDGQDSSDEEITFKPRQFADWREIPSEIVEKQEIRQAVRKALESLPDKYREVFVLRDMQGLSVAETAEVLGVSEPAIKTQLHRARLQVREQLAPVFGKKWTERLPFLKGKKPW